MGLGFCGLASLIGVGVGIRDGSGSRTALEGVGGNRMGEVTYEGLAGQVKQAAEAIKAMPSEARAEDYLKIQAILQLTEVACLMAIMEKLDVK